MIKVLIDENLPALLVSTFEAGSIHATQLGARMADIGLWNYAREYGLVILTQDADYFDLLTLHGSPPKVVWVRTGNLRLAQLQQMINSQWPSVVQLLRDADLVMIHADRLEAIRFESR